MEKNLGRIIAVMWYCGRVINGDENPTIYSDLLTELGDKDFRIEDLYLNSDTAKVYKCVKSGKADAAEWIYTGLRLDTHQTPLGSLVYRGEVDTLADLPVFKEKGDFYNVTATKEAVFWTGEKWQNINATVDLSDYETKDNVRRIAETLESNIRAVERVVAPAWESKSYTKGANVTDEGIYYECLLDHATGLKPKDNPTYWKATNTGAQISQINSDLTEFIEIGFENSIFEYEPRTNEVSKNKNTVQLSVNNMPTIPISTGQDIAKLPSSCIPKVPVWGVPVFNTNTYKRLGYVFILTDGNVRYYGETITDAWIAFYTTWLV